MKKILFVGLGILFGYQAISQVDVAGTLRKETSRAIKKDADTTKWNWKRGGVLSFNLSQGSLSNWAAGGDNFTLSVASYFNYFFYYQKERQSWDNNIDFNIGYLQTTSQGSRKNDDRFDFLSKYGYKMDTLGKWYVSGLFDFRSQFFDGYTYSGSTPVFSSTLLSPAYLVLSAGFDYKPSDKFSVFMSPLTSRTVIVANNYLSRLGEYGVDSGKHTLAQLGAFVTINYNNTFSKIVTYKARMDLFSNYINNPQNINFFMTNQVTCKLSKYFSVSYSLDMIYDDNVRLFGPHGTSPGLQTKSLIGIGFLKPLNVRKRLIPAKTT
jgi:hypothetical protein